MTEQPAVRRLSGGKDIAMPLLEGIADFIDQGDQPVFLIEALVGAERIKGITKDTGNAEKADGRNLDIQPGGFYIL